MGVRKRPVYVSILVMSSWIFASVNAAANNTNDTNEDPDINCGDGLILPIWKPDTDFQIGQRIGRGILYALILLYLFVGISIVSDRFMESIEMITSQEKEVVYKDKASGKKQVVIVKVWNETVANLTLMALGSSAPEILLSVIEIIGNDFNAGSLGPGTIVGSAAFNLFIIIGICIYVIPDGEVRKIKHPYVFAVTATWSVFAYVWLYIILAVTSPERVEPWEGILTFIFFFLVVITAYLADKKMYFSRMSRFRRNKSMRKKSSKGGGVSIENIVEDEVDDEEVLEEDDPEVVEFMKTRTDYVKAMKKIRLERPSISLTELEALALEEVFSKSHKSRAYYRMYSTSKMIGKISLNEKLHKYLQELASKPDLKSFKLANIDEDPDRSIMEVFFKPYHYTIFEDQLMVQVAVAREGGNLESAIQVDYSTEDGTAIAGSDYINKTGTLTFGPDETRQRFTVEIMNNDLYEEDEHFFIRLSNPRFADGKEIPMIEFNRKSEPALQLGTKSVATVMILDDDHGGVFQLERSEVEISEGKETLEMTVKRSYGARGKVAVPYSCEDGTGKAGKDFAETKGQLIFLTEETMKTISIPILQEDSYEKNVVFFLTLGNPISLSPEGLRDGVNYDELEAKDPSRLTDDEKFALNGKPRLGATTRAQIRIRESKEFKNAVDRMLKRGNASMVLGATSWKEQIQEAMTIEGESLKDHIFHYFTLFWKVLFAVVVPPTGFFKGYLCFFISIATIGIVTAIIGDVAGQLGCFINLKDSINAITFVALGTSVPDTFASKLAAVQDDSADNSIGNVTGSNAVNVFLGIGIAWSIASCYWAAKGENFAVSAGSLGFSVTIFCIEAVIAIIILYIRRHPSISGGELGGPKWLKAISSAFFLLLWIIFVTVSALEAYQIIQPNF